MQPKFKCEQAVRVLGRDGHVSQIYLTTDKSGTEAFLYTIDLDKKDVIRSFGFPNGPYAKLSLDAWECDIEDARTRAQILLETVTTMRVQSFETVRDFKDACQTLITHSNPNPLLDQFMTKGGVLLRARTLLSLTDTLISDEATKNIETRIINILADERVRVREMAGNERQFPSELERRFSSIERRVREDFIERFEAILRDEAMQGSDDEGEA